MNTWTVEDFITYLYQLIADADLETAPEEIALVKQKATQIISKHFFSATYSYEASLKKIQATEGVSLIDCRQIINEMIPKFDLSKEVKTDLFNDFNAIASADHKISQTENETIGFIKRALQATEMPLSW